LQLQAENTILSINLKHIVPENHFLRRLKESFPWNEWAKPFEKCFKGEKEYGPKGYPVSALLKITVLSFLYNLSDKQTEDFVKDSLPARYFVGFGLHQRTPDETTICRFRGRIANKRFEGKLKDFFNEVISFAQNKGIEIGKVQIIDSVHTESKINTKNDDGLKSAGKTSLKDPDAAWGCKGQEKKVNPQTGEVTKTDKWFYGYKSHVSYNQKTGLATGVLVSPGNYADITAAKPLIKDDIKNKIKYSVVTADRAYDSIELHGFCNKHDIFNAIRLKNNRTNHKSKKLNDYWKEHASLPFYKCALKIRYKIEQYFGVSKLHHGFAKCRYYGEIKYAFQSFLTFGSINLKRMMKLLEKSPQFKMKLAFNSSDIGFMNNTQSCLLPIT